MRLPAELAAAGPDELPGELPRAILPVETSRTYNDRSWNRVNDHYDSSVDYKKLYGALAQGPEWLSEPYAAAKIY